MRIEIVNDVHRFSGLNRDWNKLLISSDYNSLFLTHEWFSCFINSFQIDNKLAVVLILDQNDIVGILPLYRDHDNFMGFNYNVLRSISNVHTPKYNFIMKRGCEAFVEKALVWVARYLRCDFVQLDYVCNQTYLMNVFSRMRHKYLKVKSLKIMKSPHILINCEWENYYHGIPKSFRKHLDSRQRRSEKDYAVELERVKGHSLDRQTLNDAFLIEDKGWKGRNRSSVLKNDQVKNFYYNLAFSLNRRGCFELLFLRFSGKRVAFDYNLNYEACCNMVKIGYDEQFKRYSPGNVLRKLAIQNAFQNNYRKYDLLGAADDYKMKLANGVDVLHKMYIFNNSATSKFLKFLLFDASDLADKLRIKKPYFQIRSMLKENNR